MRVQLTGADHTHPVSLLHRGRRGYYEEAWPYVPVDFARADESDDALMYAASRLVAHLDAPARAALTAAYRCLLRGFAHAHHHSAPPSSVDAAASTANAGAGAPEGASPLAVLDTCSSWLSHLPDDALPPGWGWG